MQLKEKSLKRIQLWALSAQVLILVAGFAIWTWLDFAEIEHQATEEIEAASLLLEEHILRSLASIDGALLQTADLVNEIGFSELRSEAAWRRLNSIARPLPLSAAIFVYDLNGDTIAASTSYPPPVFNAGERRYFQDLVAGNSDHYIGRALQGRTVHNLFFPVARAIKAADGHVQAVAQVGVEVDYIADLFTKAELRGKTFGLYRLSDGAVVARHPATERLLDETITSQSFFPALAEGDPYYTGWVDAGGSRQLLTARRVSELPVLLTASIPKAQVFGHAYEQLAWRGLGLLIAVGALTTLGIMLLVSARRESRSIEQQQLSEQELRTSEQRFRLALRNAPVSVAVQNLDLRYVWAYNQRTARPDEIVGKFDADIFTSEEAAHLTQLKQRVLGENVEVREQMWLKRPGGPIFLDVYLEPLRDEDGRVTGIGCATVDLTPMKIAGEALRQSEARYRMLHESLRDAFVRVGMDGRLLEFNGHYCEMLGYTPEELHSLTYQDLTPERWRAFEDSIVQGQIIKRGYSDVYEKEYRRKDGTIIPVELRTILARDSEGHPSGMWGLVREITERKSAEQKLQDSELRYRGLFEAMTEGFALHEIICDAAGKPIDYRFLEVNSAFESLTKLKRCDLVGKRVLEVLPGTEPKWIDSFGRVALTGESIHIEEFAREMDRWYAVFSYCPTPGKFAVVFTDISARKRAEEALRDLNENLELAVKERTVMLVEANRELAERAQQLRLLTGELTMAEQRERKQLAKILHDGLQQYLVAAKLQLGGLIEQTRDETRQTALGVESLLGESIKVSRTLAAELSPPILHDGGILVAMEWLSRWMANKHGLQVDLVGEMDSPVLSEDVKVLLFESVRELLLNVVKHAKTNSARVHMSQEGGSNLRITVSDHGSGFDTANTPKRAHDYGGGFGLFSIRERIDLIGGRFEIDSCPGRGSTFTLIAPLGTREFIHPKSDPTRTVDHQPLPIHPLNPNGKIRIMLADDHAVMREGLARLIDREPDFEVVGEANDGREAVEKASALRPQIILMDIGMPHLDGIEATKIIRRKHPDIRIVGLSLYAEHERAKEMLDAGADLYLTKSGPATDLKTAIRACVEEQATDGTEKHPDSQRMKN